MVKNPPASAGESGSIPGLERSPGEGMATRSRIHAWKIPWTEEPGGPQFARLQRVRLNNNNPSMCRVGQLCKQMKCSAAEVINWHGALVLR